MLKHPWRLVGSSVMLLSMMVAGWLLIRDWDLTKNWLATPNTSNSQSLAQLAGGRDRMVVPLSINNHGLFVEVVKTPASITLGLGGRTEIGRDGMLFVLPERRVATFWMKDMLFDLDMVWIDGDTIVGITANVPAPQLGAEDSELPTYPSQVPVTHVLEVPAGTAGANGYAIGQTVRFLPR